MFSYLISIKQNTVGLYVLKVHNDSQRNVHRFQEDIEEVMYYQRIKIKAPFSVNKRRLRSDAAFPSFFFEQEV